jgi:hypothetical protein
VTRIHPRQQQVSLAQTRLTLMIYEEAEKFGLTDIELLQALASMQQSVLRTMLRVERHGDPTKPAGLDETT